MIPMDLLCGVDEVGRGCVAGPIVACAALFRTSEPSPRDFSPIPGIKDSKKFSTRKARAKVRDLILAAPELVSFQIVAISAEEIDKIGIEAANQLAFLKALQQLPEAPPEVIVDGNKLIKKWLGKQLVLPKADDNFWPVGAASILAKCHRDEYMDQLAIEHEDAYHWTTNAGYGSKAHMEAIKTRGFTPYHRRSFLSKIEVCE